MQDAAVDQKLHTLSELYEDQTYCVKAMGDVERIRASAQNYGILTTIAAFSFNEAARLTLRSPLFKLKAQNVAFWAIAPSLFFRYTYTESIHERIDNMWRIHKYREKKGLGGTKTSNGVVKL